MTKNKKIDHFHSLYMYCTVLMCKWHFFEKSREKLSKLMFFLEIFTVSSLVLGSLIPVCSTVLTGVNTVCLYRMFSNCTCGLEFMLNFVQKKWHFRKMRIFF